MTDDKKKGETLRKEGAKWIERIKAASEHEKTWIDDAEKAAKAYANEEKSDGEVGIQGNLYDYNILYANVETIVPAVINSQPLPDIRRRFNDADPAARVVADILERAIRVQTDDNKLQIEMEAAAQDAFLAGRGIVRLRFKSDIVGGELEDDDIEDAAEGLDAGGDSSPSRPSHMGDERQSGGVGDDGALLGAPSERVENERLCFEAVSWRDYRHGPAKRWDERPWDAFRFVIPREESDKRFDKELIASQLNDQEKTERTGADELTGWEVWCKESKTVKFIDDDGIILKTVEDPLGLTDFFPICTPMQPIELTGRLKPVNPFAIYKRLADELDSITKRIDKLVDAMRVKGWYAVSAKDLENVVNLQDNEWAPVGDAELWAQNGGIEKALAFWPIERFIAVLKELYVAREQTKQAIYEITGISDIIRGATKATETLGAQEIKSQWGSLRIQKMQRMLERAARDIFVMMAEIITSKFSYETLQEMTGIPILPAEGDDEQTVAQKMAVIQLMQRRVSSYYRIDVESDSTIRADLTRQKAEVSEFLQGAAAYFQAVAPLVQQGALPADAAVDIFASTARMFNLGKSVEDTLEKMVTDAKAKAQQPQDEKPDPEVMKAQLEQQKMQMEGQTKQAELQMKMQEAQLKAQQQEQAAMIARDEAMFRLQSMQAETDIKRQQLAADMQMTREKHMLEMEKLRVEIEKIQAGTVATVESARAKAEAAKAKEPAE